MWASRVVAIGRVGERKSLGYRRFPTCLRLLFSHENKPKLTRDSTDTATSAFSLIMFYFTCFILVKMMKFGLVAFSLLLTTQSMRCCHCYFQRRRMMLVRQWDSQIIVRHRTTFDRHWYLTSLWMEDDDKKKSSFDSVAIRSKPMSCRSSRCCKTR